MKAHLPMNLYVAACLCAGMALSGCGEYTAKYEKTGNMVVPVSEATELCVETDVGSITVTGADVSDCDIVANITVKAETQEQARQLAEKIEVEAKPSGDRLSVKVSKPAELKKRPLEVKFRIIAPRQLKLNCSINVGNVDISEMKDRIKVSGNVGSIFCRQIIGHVNVTSNVGSVEVEYEDAAPAALDIDITTNVGSIELTAPPQLSAQVTASTNVGSVKTDKPITVVGKVGKSINGTMGSGQGKVRLETNVGSIRIK